ncbi:SRPBCC domain-containing protein [Streptomyces sp. NPDC053367]|uniref:SRPBCC domain-containing protein n=1 Tax=Streptomyces sp. NPDC053367 TaxID=3365700 RepID=UPI0037CE023F
MPTGLTQDAGWEIGVSRTLPHPPSVVWEAVSGPDGLARWLGPGAAPAPERGARYRTADGVEGEVRGYRAGERVRVTRGSTTVQVTVSPAAGGTKAVLRFHEEHLSSADERESRRAHWRGVIDGIARDLG